MVERRGKESKPPASFFLSVTVVTCATPHSEEAWSYQGSHINSVSLYQANSGALTSQGTAKSHKQHNNTLFFLREGENHACYVQNLRMYTLMYSSKRLTYTASTAGPVQTSSGNFHLALTLHYYAQRSDHDAIKCHDTTKPTVHRLGDASRKQSCFSPYSPATFPHNFVDLAGWLASVCKGLHSPHGHSTHRDAWFPPLFPSECPPNPHAIQCPSWLPFCWRKNGII